MTSCVILGRRRKEFQSRNATELLSCKKKSTGFLRCSLGLDWYSADRLLQDSEGLAGRGRGYGSGLPSGAFEMDHTVIAGAEVAHTGLIAEKSGGNRRNLVALPGIEPGFED